MVGEALVQRELDVGNVAALLRLVCEDVAVVGTDGAAVPHAQLRALEVSEEPRAKFSAYLLREEVWGRLGKKEKQREDLERLRELAELARGAGVRRWRDLLRGVQFVFAPCPE